MAINFRMAPKFSCIKYMLAVNPARDASPRLAKWRTKVSSTGRKYDARPSEAAMEVPEVAVEVAGVARIPRNAARLSLFGEQFLPKIYCCRYWM